MSSHSGPPPAVVEIVEDYLKITLQDKDGSSSIEFHEIQRGLSSTKTWLVGIGSTRFILKHWPVRYTDLARLRWIGSTVQKSHEKGFSLCARQHLTQPILDGNKEITGFIELLCWKPGIPLEATDGLDRQLEAITTLCRFHNSLSDHTDAHRGKSAAIQKRIERLKSLNIRKLPNVSVSYDNLRESLLKKFELVANEFHLQPTQVDSRPEHFLLEDGKVTAMIDFGAMAIDTPAIDLARLVGELALEDMRKWETLVSRYLKLRNPDFDERLVRLLDLSGALIGLANWQAWMDSEKVSPEQAEPRLRTLARRIESSHSQLP